MTTTPCCCAKGRSGRTAGEAALYHSYKESAFSLYNRALEKTCRVVLNVPGIYVPIRFTAVPLLSLVVVVVVMVVVMVVIMLAVERAVSVTFLLSSSLYGGM